MTLDNRAPIAKAKRSPFTFDSPESDRTPVVRHEGLLAARVGEDERHDGRSGHEGKQGGGAAGNHGDGVRWQAPCAWSWLVGPSQKIQGNTGAFREVALGQAARLLPVRALAPLRRPQNDVT